MNITRLFTKNTKGRSFDLVLAPLTLITGPNYSGKTTALDSIRLALMGKLPQTATNKGIYEMASGLRMTVGLNLSTGERLEREYWRDGDSIKAAGTPSEFSSALLDSGEYFALSPTERMAYVAARVDVGASGSLETILDGLRAALEAGKINTTIMLDTLAEVKAVLDEQGAQEGLNRLLYKGAKPQGFNLAAQYTYWNSRVKDTVGAVRTLSELKNRGEECSAETLESIAREIAGLHGRLSEAHREQGKLVEATQAANRQAVRRQQLEKLLATPREDLAAKIDALKADEASYRKQRDGLDLANGKTANEYVIEITELQRKLDRATGDVARLEGDIEANRAKREELAHLSACPYCKSKSQKWKGVVEKELEAEKTNLASLQQEAVESVNATNSFLRIAREAHKARAMKETDAVQIDNAIRDTKQAIERLTAKADEEARTIAAAKNELAAMHAETVDQSAIDAAVSHSAALKAKLDAATARRDAAVALQQDIRRATEAQEEHETAKANLEAVKIAGTFLKEEQQKGINAVIRSLLDGANFFTKNIMVASLALHENEIGYFLPSGQFVGHRTFSGLEEIITYLAISCALSAKSKLRVALLDELGTLTENMQAAVLNRVKEAVKAGMLDQSIAVIPIDNGQVVDADGWEIISLKP